MNIDEIIKALDLPISSRVDKRVPKKLLLENGAITSADKRYINDGIEELLWLATLKSTTVGVPEYRDNIREYLEIAVLRLSLRPEAKAFRLMELVHRAIPYPLLLLTEQSVSIIMSAAHKRWAQNQAGKIVLDGELIVVDWIVGEPLPWLEYQNSLALGRQPSATIYSLYQGWINTLIAIKAYKMTGFFNPDIDDHQASIRADALRECTRLEVEIARLKAAVKKEKQISKQVELNLEIKRIQNELNAAHAKL